MLSILQPCEKRSVYRWLQCCRKMKRSLMRRLEDVVTLADWRMLAPLLLILELFKLRIPEFSATNRFDIVLSMGSRSATVETCPINHCI